MQVADIRLAVSKFHDYPMHGVTAAEAQVLTVLHANRTDGKPIVDVTNVREGKTSEGKPLTNALILQYLRAKFTKRRIDAIFPGAAPRLPQTYQEVLAPEASKQVELDEAEQAVAPKTFPVVNKDKLTK